MKTINSYLPVFNGFYGTWFEYNNEGCDIEHYNDENGTNLDFESFDFDYKDHMQRISEACVEAIESELSEFNVGLKMEKLVSPREYNFTNDSINVKYTISDEGYDNLVQYLHDNYDEYKEYIKERYTSRDGFSSLYSNDADFWLESFKIANENDLEHTFGSLLDFYFKNEGYTDLDLAQSSEVEMENWINFDVK